MKERVQTFGRFLSGMVMPNIGAFIAWGLIAALFIETGWVPNAAFARLVGPMSHVMLPLLIAYTGGKVVAGDRGGLIGAITAMGVIVASENPMFLGAMAVGPFAGWVIKRFDKMMDGHIPPGFEMLVNNFSVGIIGMILCLLAMLGVTPLVNGLTAMMSSGVGFLVEHSLLPLTSVFIEPAKVLFLNNALNQGIFSPLGIQEVQEAGKSVFFLLEANPGPGLGILLAYCLAGKGSAKSSAPGAVIIHYRAAFVKLLNQFAAAAHSECSGGKEQLELQYKTVKTIENPFGDIKLLVFMLLNHQREHHYAEISSRQCLSGPHKDDLDVLLNGLPAKSYASQGQTRTAALSLKLAAREIHKEIIGEYPILLLDDVLSELDPKRQEFVLNRISGGQVFITCCEDDRLSRMLAGRVFHVREGSIL